MVQILQLDLDSICAQVFQYAFDTIFINGTNRFSTDPKLNPAIFALNPKASIMQIGAKPAFGFDVRMRNVVSANRLFSSNLTNPWHRSQNLKIEMCESRRTFYTID